MIIVCWTIVAGHWHLFYPREDKVQTTPPPPIIENIFLDSCATNSQMTLSARQRERVDSSWDDEELGVVFVDHVSCASLKNAVGLCHSSILRFFSEASYFTWIRTITAAQCKLLVTEQLSWGKPEVNVPYLRHFRDIVKKLSYYYLIMLFFFECVRENGGDEIKI